MKLTRVTSALLFLSLASCPLPVQSAQPSAAREWIAPSEDNTHFIEKDSGKKFVVWGFNYDHDDSGRLIEDYWHEEWQTVVQDFQEMKALGANTVRVHLQLPKFMEAADKPNERNLAQLAKLVKLAEQTGLYLDITGLGCYHKQDVPAWYDALDETARWQVQARFWQAVAKVCRDSPAIFCYDLMNEPIIGGGANPDEWLAGELGGKHFVQRLTLEPGDRTREQIAAAWVKKLTDAIREIDDRHMITVGVIPWAKVFKGAKPLFYSPEVGKPLDFVSVHFYPEKGQLEETLAALKVYEVGKPLVIEEIFPLAAGLDETAEFIEASRAHADGWISFYWGTTIEEYAKKNDIKSAILREWLTYFRDKATDITGFQESRETSQRQSSH